MEEKWRPGSFSPVPGQSAMGERCMSHPDTGRWVETGGTLLSLRHLNAQKSLASRLDGRLGNHQLSLLTPQMGN